MAIGRAGTRVAGGPGAHGTGVAHRSGVEYRRVTCGEAKGEQGRITEATPPSVLVAKSVLVVEDDRHSRQGLRDGLVHRGYAVETAADGWQAIKTIRERSFEAAIVDLDLPPVHGVDVGGWDLVRIFRAYNPSIAIIVVSAVHDAALQLNAERLRVAAFLEKPISLVEVAAILRGIAS